MLVGCGLSLGGATSSWTHGGGDQHRQQCCPANSACHPLQEIARLLALEEATLSTDLQQGYALKSLTGRESRLVLPLGVP